MPFLLLFRELVTENKSFIYIRSNVFVNLPHHFLLLLKLHKIMEKKFYIPLTATWLHATAVTLTACIVPIAAVAQTVAPEKPVNLSAETDYNKVVLKWENPVKTETLLSEDFEGDKFPNDGWSLKTTNTDYFMNTWFNFPTSEMIEAGISDEDINMFVHGGKKSALVYLDNNAPHADGSSAVQDEWLYMPATAGAEYVSFYSYINPILLEYAQNEEFPDHYYVEVSHDGGQTWKHIWDARTDMANEDKFQDIRLYLGDPAQGDPIVAFHAVSDVNNPESGLYFAWAIDDVTLSKSTGNSNAAAAEAYNLYLDGNMLAENLYSTKYTDLSNKEPGDHKYEVEAVSHTANLVSEKAELNVNIKEPVTNAPKNVKLTYKNSDTTGKYDVTVTWDAPDGDRKPVNYSVYCNNALVAGYMEEMEVEQTGKPKGAYTYQVVANYQYPEGESERTAAEANIAIGTRFPATNLETTRNGNGSQAMVWNAPKASEYTVKNYAIYRGNTKIGETENTNFTETDSPKGIYSYAVKAVYSDGETALPATKTVKNGETPNYTLPFTEDFTGGLTPENWQIEKVDGKMQDQYLWRFDNWFELPVSGGNFSGDFASLASSVAGYTRVWSTLDTPPLVRGDLGEGEKTFLEFDLDYNATGKTSEAGVYYSYDGDSWAPIDEFEGYQTEDLANGTTCKPEHKTYDITDKFQDATTPVYLAWSYKGKVANHMAIDNVKVYNATSATSIQNARNNIAYSIDGNTLSVNGASRIQVYSADGVCTFDVTSVNHNNTKATLSKGLNIVKISTINGIKTIKINR